MTRRTPLPLTLAQALALTLTLTAACDDAGEQRKDDTKTVDGKAPDGKAVDDKAAPPAELRKFKSPAEAIGAYNTCYSDCFTEKANATNRETCKLDCDGLAETGMDVLKTEAEKTTYKTTWTTLRGCITGCWEDRKLNQTNRATCLLTCSDAAEIGATPMPPSTGTPPTTGTPPATTPPATTPPATGTPPVTGTPPAK